MFKFFFLSALVGTSVWGAPKGATHLDGRIVGGVDTTIEAHPYMASLLQQNWHICGGSIISPTWILTAAHCVTGAPTSYSVRVGSTIRNSGGEVIAARRVIMHPNYNSRIIDYDIAVLELVSPITNPISRAIGMYPQGNKPAGGTISVITGWGTLSEGGVLPTILQVVEVPIVSQAICRAAYGEDAITDRMLCAGVLGIGGKDACQGDSGGPLTVNGLVTGVVSWGAGCARPDFPGVYASVPNLRNWVRDNTGI